MKYNKLMKLLNPGFDFNSALAHALNRGRVTLKKVSEKMESSSDFKKNL